MITPREYYRSEYILKRMIEYLGGNSRGFSLEKNISNLANSHNLKEITKTFTNEYLVGWGDHFIKKNGRPFESVYNDSLGWLLDNSADVFRSVWDKKNMLFIIDIEYYSKKYPHTPYIDPEYTYDMLEPYYILIKETLHQYNINPFILTTGQGYHFVFKISYKSNIFKKLSELGHIENTLLGKYQHLPPGTKRKRIVSKEEGHVYDMVGKLLEHFYHILIIKIRNGFNVKLPLMIGDISVGNEKNEAISFDLSGYANPLFMRDIRLPFSTHQKHKVHPHKIGYDIANLVPIQLAIPRYIPDILELSLKEVFKNRRHYENTVHLAEKIKCNIPDCEDGVNNLLKEYLNSKLYEFHKNFDKTKQEPPERWKYTYDMFNLSEAPPCVAHAIANPNPLLLQPTQIQTLVRTLCGKQWWHPKHIAGLIRSKYERNYKWEVDFYKYDANTWANVWTRIYAGMLVDNTDDLCDFNCISHQEKGISWAGKPFCVKPNCGYSLGNYR